MNRTATTIELDSLSRLIEGEFYTEDAMRKIYATDGSHYRELPLAVAIPKTTEDIKTLIHFANQQKTSLIPRTAGTSLAGQVVGNGIVVDVSKYFTKIIELNQAEGWVRVEPGVVRDELNLFLKDYGLFFGPETSTANRAMMGGMIGNNSCGSNSIIYGSTRDNLLAVKGFLSDGEIAEFGNINPDDFNNKIQQNSTLENHIYKEIHQLLAQPENQDEIRANFPKASIPRRNTGYALDILLETNSFSEGKADFNLSKLIAGSEGTLMFITEAKLKVVPLPPKNKVLICGHYPSIGNALKANLIALKFQPNASELIDRFILDCTIENSIQRENRFFVEGDPEAILVIEIARDDLEVMEATLQELLKELRDSNLGYAFPVLRGDDMKKVWDLRKAGLGVLGNMKGDAKPTELVEDTAVDVQQLPEYIAEFDALMKSLNVQSVHYAHAGTGEIHLKPILNLKTSEGQYLYRKIAEETARLVKRYNGSLSGEHGDGRLRGEFIPWIIGEKNYALLIQVKEIFDPNHIFNPNKIVNTPPMDKFLRHEPDEPERHLDTVMDFSEAGGYLALAEKCTGSADCRKSALIGGTMCPSYMATRNEKDTTRARANILREVLSNSSEKNPFASEEIKEVMDLCLSCKGCKSECPSNVDVAKLKTEFLQQYYDKKGIPFRTHLIAGFTKANQLASIFPALYNFLFTHSFTANIGKRIASFHPKRSMPLLYHTTLKNWYKKNKKRLDEERKNTIKKIYFFADEFSNFNDTEIGIKSIELLNRLGYEVIIPKHLESGRTYISKGLLRKAKKIAQQNIILLKDLINEKSTLIGIEPSAILTFRDEYIDLAGKELKADAQKIADCTFTFEEFFANEIKEGNISKESFTKEKKLIKVHGHCYQKSLSSLTPSKLMLTLPENYEVHMIASGCCGMAGSFGYEKEHYELSMQIAELVLLPTIRTQDQDTLICAAGTSCRHQIKDGAHKKAFHPAEILWEALV